LFVSILDLLLVVIIIGAFAFGVRKGIAAVILIRPVTDRLFELGSVSFGGGKVTFGVLVNIIIICATLVNILGIRRRTPAGLRTIWFPFLIVCAIATLYSPAQLDASRRLFSYVCDYCVFSLAFLVVRSDEDVLYFLKCVVLSSVLPLLYGFYEIVSGTDWFDESRIQSTFSHPNMFAFYLVAVTGVMLFLTTTKQFQISPRLRLFLNLYLIPVLVMLVMTKTRSAWGACAVLLLIYGILRDRRVLIFMMIALPLAFLIPAVHDRISNLTTENDYIGGSAIYLNSYAWRQLLWEGALSYISQRPIFGYGLHSFLFYSPEFFPATRHGTYAHNDYVQLLFETGIVGLLAFLWIFWRCAVWLNRYWQADANGATAAAAMILIYLICSSSDNLLEYLPFQWEFWFPVAVMCWSLARFQLPVPQNQFAKWAADPRRPRLGAGETMQRRAGGPEL
jgi:putative inorganic carbon (hco3(-)) transporter